MKTSQLILCREIIAVCSQIHTRHINTMCGQKVEYVDVKNGGTYSEHWASRILVIFTIILWHCGTVSQ
jgi:hypothetical protein